MNYKVALITAKLASFINEKYEDGFSLVLQHKSINKNQKF